MRDCMKFIATHMPQSEPMGLKLCARLSLRVAFSFSPIDRMNGLALVSRKLSPQVSMKYATRNGQ